MFWEQFKVSVHERSLPDSEKLVYLRSALKDGTAKGVIEGLSRSVNSILKLLKVYVPDMTGHVSFIKHMLR